MTRRADIDDLETCATVLADAFADYPWTRWTVDTDDHHERIRGLQRLALARLGFAYGQVWATEVDTAIAGVAVWMDSAVEIPHDPAVAAETAALEGSRHAASAAASARLAAWPPAERHYVLATVGTTPSLQGRGIATATLQPMLARADAERVSVYLETSSAGNVAFYEQLGFVVTDHCALEPDGPDVWAMVRR